jgi:hypothetical protein
MIGCKVIGTRILKPGISDGVIELLHTPTWRFIFLCTGLEEGVRGAGGCGDLSLFCLALLQLAVLFLTASSHPRSKCVDMHKEVNIRLISYLRCQFSLPARCLDLPFGMLSQCQI